ncbi:MAG: tRNA (guanosine(37)-N1)-methyltransferase TrmD [Saprospiraceae bacterium]|nr:tRNA (guanosine(37)-N1)-methyltransferase TrmD [Saprospiraceae bacterium]
MQIDIISIVPDLLKSPFEHSIMKRAAEKGILTVQLINLRPYGLGLYHQTDDYQYGGGAGMVMMCEPLDNCISELKAVKKYDQVIYLTPDGKTFNQKTANYLSCQENLLLICGHYKGIDQRIRDIHVTMEVSVGDFVLSGGELAAAIVVDAIGRLLPGVLNDETSALTDSFQDNLLAPPVFTRPADYKGWKVPDVLLSGNERLIDEWRFEASLRITQEKRPDLLED